MSFRRKLKNFLNHYSMAVIKVREATSNDSWGPSGTLMSEIADLTYHADSFSEIMHILWHRLNDRGEKWRHVYKSLTLLDYLIKNGSKRVITNCREGLYNIQILKEFQYIDESGRDQGIHVQEKAKQIIALLMDENMLSLERQKAYRIKIRMLKSLASNSHTIEWHQGTEQLPVAIGIETFSHFGKVLENVQTMSQIQDPAMCEESTVMEISNLESVQDLLMLCEDKSLKTNTRADSCPAAVSITRSSAMSLTSTDPLKASREQFISAVPKEKASAIWTQDCSKRITLKPPPRPLSGNTASVRQNPWQETVKTTPGRKDLLKLDTSPDTWARELQKLDPPSVSNLLLSPNSAVPSKEASAFLIPENSSSIPWADFPPTFESSKSIPVRDSTTQKMNKPTLFENNTQINVNTQTNKSVFWPQQCPHSKFTSRSCFPSCSSQASSTLHAKPFSSWVPRLSPVVTEETIGIQRPISFSAVQSKPYFGTNPFQNPVMPTPSTVRAPFFMVTNPRTAFFQPPAWPPGAAQFDISSYSSIYPAASSFTQTTVSAPLSNPASCIIERGITATVPQTPTPQSHPANPFL